MSSGNKLRIIRQSLRISQAEMAALMGITQSHYSNLESGKKNIAAHLIVALFEVLKVSPSWFFKEEGEIFSEPLTPKDADEDMSNENNAHTSKSHQISPTDISMGQIMHYLALEEQGLSFDDCIKAPEESSVDILHSYQRQAVKSYYQLSDRSLDNKIVILKREYKDLYNDYYMLVEAINNFELGSYSAKLEIPISLNEKLEKIEKNVISEYAEIEDNKLKVIFHLLEYEDEIETIKQALHIAIVKFNEVSKLICKKRPTPNTGGNTY